jgi:hypothetical protein
MLHILPASASLYRPPLLVKRKARGLKVPSLLQYFSTSGYSKTNILVSIHTLSGYVSMPSRARDAPRSNLCR